jgi:hypothetical protein
MKYEGAKVITDDALFLEKSHAGKERRSARKRTT